MADMALIKVTVAPFESHEHRLWDQFLERSANGTFYHDLAFSQLYAWKVERIVNLAFREENRVVALLTAGIAVANGRWELHSPFSASFGGLAVDLHLSLREALAIVRELEGWAKGEGIQQIVLQQPPMIYAECLDETLEFALRYAGFEQIGTELSYYLNSLEGIESGVLRNARKAEVAGCHFGETDDCGGVWDFLAEVKAAHDHPFDIRREDLLRLHDAFPGRIRCFEVVRGQARVAAILAYELNRHVLLGFHWAQRVDAQQYRPTDLLILETARWAFARGLRAFDLGTTTLSGEPAWGVTQFKEKFRPPGVLRRRFAKMCA